MNLWAEDEVVRSQGQPHPSLGPLISLSLLSRGSKNWQGRRYPCDAPGWTWNSSTFGCQRLCELKRKYGRSLFQAYRFGRLLTTHTSFHDINETHEEYFSKLHIHFSIRVKNALGPHILFFIWSLKTNVPSTAASGKWFKQINARHDQIRSRGPPHTKL